MAIGDDILPDGILDWLVSAVLPTAAATVLVSAGLIGGSLVAGPLIRRDSNPLPTCLSGTVRNTLTELAIERGVSQPRIHRRLPAGPAEGVRTCSAQLSDGKGRTVPITYRIARSEDGQVRVTAEWQAL